MRLLLIILSFFILCGCSESGTAHSVELNKTPNIVRNGVSPNDAGNNQTIRVIKDGGNLCEGYLLKKATAERVEGSQVIKLKSFNTNDETLPPELRKWLQTSIHKEMLVTFELKYKGKKVLILRANVAGATGIAANFENWFIQLDNRSINFQSLSKNPELIFWDKDGLLNYYSINYGDKFLENKDWDNLTLDLLRYSVSPDGKAQLVSEEQNVKCE